MHHGLAPPAADVLLPNLIPPRKAVFDSENVLSDQVGNVLISTGEGFWGLRINGLWDIVNM